MVRSKANGLAWTVLLFFACLLPLVAADGEGMLGAGKYLYKPACAHACRRRIEYSELLCDSKLPGDNSSSGSHLHRRHVHEAANSLECYLKDAAFLRTLALCIEQFCAEEDVQVSVIEDFWEGHVATGSVGDWSLKPIMSYQRALQYAHEDMEEVGEANMPFAVMKEPLNATSLVREEDYQPYVNGLLWFEGIEKNHGRNAIAVAVSSVFIPVLFSLLRFLPGRALWYSRLENALESPLFGKRHRTPTMANLGIMPTRGQTLYIVYLLATQIFLGIFPLSFIYPNYIAPTKAEHLILMIGDRTGALAMADFVAIFLSSSRNNILLWITNWSHSTFLLLHRWIAYCLIFQVSMHSVLMLVLYYPDHASESQKVYWIWGIVGTLAFVIMWPASLLPVRQKAYEFFLASHQIFAALGLIATFFHIYELYMYKWGYEIWVYIGGIIWFGDRLLRVLRMVKGGWRRAVVSAVDEHGDYLRVEVDGVAADGHVYLYFPTLNWRVWENHPYSVLSSFSGSSTSHDAKDASEIGGDPEKTSHPSSNTSLSLTSDSNAGVRPRTTILLRVMDGQTKLLANRLAAAGSSRRISIPVIVEGSYHANPATRDLAHCSSLLCIAGGVGITAVVPIIRSFGGPRVRLAWGVRSQSLLGAVEPELRRLDSKKVEVQTSVGERIRIVDILKEELGKDDEGDLGVVVCGPTGMADEIRVAVAELGPRARRAVVFVDEAFSW
ncbi:metalloreductase [Coprinopsis marcescibilis]|uniref:Metalloreductase n=1 Tax=Coprinopsis marcescibilis TaxID=230819 RepID=A0A5C3KHT8_COPMA|nr:metalloreductase [Coprinopsis marcescibilis]